MRAKPMRARRYAAPSADAELTVGENRFARALAGAEPGNIAPDDLPAAYAAAWPGRAKRFRPTTVAANTAALLAAPLIKEAIAHYRAEREAAPERLDWGRAQRAQAAHQRRVRLGLGVRAKSIARSTMAPSRPAPSCAPTLSASCTIEAICATSMWPRPRRSANW